MAEIIIPKSHYFKSPTSATPLVFNRIWDDINNAFSKLWDGAVACDAEHDIIILDSSNTLTPSTVKITDTTFWPDTVKNVSLTFALETGSQGSITPGSSTKGGYAHWNPPAGGFTWSAGKAPIQVIVKMTASYDVERIAEETMAGNGTASYTVQNTPDPTFVEAWIDDVPVTVSGVTGTTITLGQTAISSQTVRIRYIWSLSESKTASTGFLIMAAPAKGSDAVTAPVPILYAPTTVSPLYGKSDGSIVAELEFEDKSLVNASDTIIREWELYTEADQVTNIIGSNIAAGYNAGSIAGAQSGDSKIVINFSNPDTYIVKLRISSSTYGEVSTTARIRILPVWQVEPNYLMDLSSTAIGAPLAVKTSIQESSPREGDPNNLYQVDPLFVKARVKVFFGIENENNVSIDMVTDNGDGTYTIETNAALTNRYNMNTDIRPGIDYLWVGNQAYPIVSVGEQGDMYVTVRKVENQEIPSSSWLGRQDLAIGPSADRYVILMRLYNNVGSPRIKEEWKTVLPFANGTNNAPIFHVYFDHIPYGTKCDFAVWGHYGTVLSNASVSSTVSITAGTAPTFTGYTVNFPTGSNTVVVAFNGAANAVLYEIEYEPHPAAGTTTVRSTKPVLALPITPSSTGSTVTFRLYNKHGDAYEYTTGLTWGDVSVTFP